MDQGGHMITGNREFLVNRELHELVLGEQKCESVLHTRTNYEL